jgi:hypothetical protein
MTQHAPAPGREPNLVPVEQVDVEQVRSRSDRFMRRLLRVTATDPNAVFGARSAMRRSIIISGIRCTITYLLVPILVPILGFMGTFAAPVSIALILYAMVNGVVSVRNFWIADHRARWQYTWFMGAVFIALTVALAFDVMSVVSR